MTQLATYTNAVHGSLGVGAPTTLMLGRRSEYGVAGTVVDVSSLGQDSGMNHIFATDAHDAMGDHMGDVYSAQIHAVALVHVPDVFIL